MVWVAILILAIATGVTIGVAARNASLKGRVIAMRSNLATALIGFALAGLSYAAVLAGRRGTFAPDHPINGVIGNAVVVGGLVVGVGMLMGAMIARFTVLKDS